MENNTSDTPTSNNSSKRIKLYALGIVSFAIPVIYFLQANELKKSEFEKLSLFKSRDSLELRLKDDSDRNIQLTRIKAYKIYTSLLTELLKPYQYPSTQNTNTTSPETEKEFKNISAQLSSVAADVSTLKNGDPNVKSIKTELDAQKATIGSLIETTSKISYNLDSLTRFIKTNPAKNNSRTADSIESYRKRLLYLQSTVDLIKASSNGKTTRVKAIENQLIIDIIQKNLASLTNDMKNI